MMYVVFEAECDGSLLNVDTTKDYERAEQLFNEWKAEDSTEDNEVVARLYLAEVEDTENIFWHIGLNEMQMLETITGIYKKAEFEVH